MPFSQGFECEDPVVWPASRFCVGGNVGSSQQQLPTASACMSGFWDPEKVNSLELFVHGQGEVRLFF